MSTLKRHTNDLEVLLYHTLSIRTHENVQIHDSTGGHPGQSRSWLQNHLYIRKKAFSSNKYSLNFEKHARGMMCVTYGTNTNCIAIEKENSMCQAILLLYYVE